MHKGLKLPFAVGTNREGRVGHAGEIVRADKRHDNHTFARLMYDVPKRRYSPRAERDPWS